MLDNPPLGTVTVANASQAPIIIISLGVTALLAALAADVPLAFVAVTANVQDVPFVKPDTVIGLAPVPVNDPGVDVAVNVAVAPPVAPAVYATVASAFPAVTASIVGACGTDVAVTPDDAELAADVPYGLVADTVYVYCVLDARPVATIGDVLPVNVDGDVVGDGVSIKELAAPPLVFGVNATDICPLLNALPEG